VLHACNNLLLFHNTLPSKNYIAVNDDVTKLIISSSCALNS
jgi:hypothetical protein